MTIKPNTKPNNPNFSSGPCSKRPGWSIQNLKINTLGRSHRAKIPKKRLLEVINLSKKILKLPNDYQVGILPASDTGAIESAMWSLLGKIGIEVLAWENFGNDWLKDIKETGREREKADEEDVDATNISPPRTKNEIVNHVPEMPDVPEIGAEEEIELVGQIVSVVGDVCVVASEKEDQAPLDETTPLCSEERFGLGFVEEVFGPITKPMYTMRYDKKKCKSANAPEKMTVGVKIFCVRSMKKTLMPEKLYSKGYDNSGANDEEIDDDGEFSDDEAEAEAKRKKNPKQRKRKE